MSMKIQYINDITIDRDSDIIFEGTGLFESIRGLCPVGIALINSLNRCDMSAIRSLLGDTF